MPTQKKHIRAAEAALGLEPIGAETKAEATLRRQWERRFAPLGLALPDERPPEDMWYRIQSALDRSEDRRTIARKKRSVWRWRLAALAATACAVGLAGFIVSQGVGAGPKPAEQAAPYIAVVTPQAEDGEDRDGSALIVEVDPQAGTARVRPVGVRVATGTSLEMWRIAPEGDPVSVGLVPADASVTLDLEADPGDIIAVSVESEGGSTTGAPSGPIVYRGSLTDVPE